MDINDSQDLNIEDYTIDELSNLFELPTPISAQSILAKLNTLVDKFVNQNNPDFVAFLEQARAKLLKSLEPDALGVNPPVFQESDDDTQASDVLDNEYWDNSKSENIPNRKNMTRIVSQQPYSVLQRERLNISQQKDVEFVQGQLNPDLKNTFIRLLNIDSHYREILDISEDLCVPPGITGSTPWKGQVIKSNLELDSPSNFTFDLSEPLSNVEEIQLNDVQIPRAWYVFDVAYGTNSFEYNDNIYKIPSGNYNGTDLATAVTSAFPGPASASFNAATNKMKITLPNTSDTIKFYN